MDNVFAAVVDIETTGLNARSDVPLEIGVALIDKEGYIFDSVHTLVWEMSNSFQNAVGLGRMNNFVNQMHTKSGLWDDLEELDHGDISLHARSAVDAYLVKWLDAHGIKPGTVPMLGNSIGSLDRPFSLVHFPQFSEMLHYRNIDISTVKELCKAHNPTLFENLRPIIGSKENATHRVMGDIEACLVEYRAYIDNFFFVED